MGGIQGKWESCFIVNGVVVKGSSLKISMRTWMEL